MLVIILLLTFVVDSNIVAYVWLSLVVTIVTIVRVNWGLVLAMTPLVFFYFYRLQSNFVVTVGLKLLYGLTLSVVGGGVGLIVRVMCSVVFLGVVESGLVWLGIRGIYFLRLTYMGVALAVLVVAVYLCNLSALAAMALILGFPLTIIFYVKARVMLKVGAMLMLVLAPILSFSLGFVRIIPPNYWSLGGLVTRLGGLLI